MCYIAAEYQNLSMNCSHFLLNQYSAQPTTAVAYKIRVNRHPAWHWETSTALTAPAWNKQTSL